MKNCILMIAIIAATCSSSFAGECVNGNCSLRSRAVNVTREVVSFPVAVTRRTVAVTKNVGQRTFGRFRAVYR